MRRTLAFATALLLAAAPAFAHPARGIAVAADGRVYFSDLERIWVIGRDGRLILVREHRDVHTHALVLTRRGDLLGEDSTYDPSDQSYKQAIWRIAPSGAFAYVYGPTRTPARGFGLQRDPRGCTYQSQQTDAPRRSLVHRRCPGKNAERLFGTSADDRRFRPVLVNDVAGTALGADGSFYFRQGATVRRIGPGGRVSLVANGLADENFGIAVDGAGQLFVAEFGPGRILGIGPDGKRRIVATSTAPWAPTGVAIGRSGLHLLEATRYRRGSPTRMRVRRIAGGRDQVLATVSIPE